MIIAVLYQEGGCDYTIGCGVKVIPLRSQLVSEAWSELQDWFNMGYEGPHSIELYEASLLDKRIVPNADEEK